MELETISQDVHNEGFVPNLATCARQIVVPPLDCISPEWLGKSAFSANSSRFDENM
jgi:hypothetical protein